MPLRLGLEDIPHSHNNAAISAIRSPLVEEIRIVNAPFRDAEIARIGQIEEVGAKLNPLVLAEPRVLDDPEVNPVDSVGA